MIDGERNIRDFFDRLVQAAGDLRRSERRP
jgi:hypothetical protein